MYTVVGSSLEYFLNLFINQDFYNHEIELE